MTESTQRQEDDGRATPARRAALFVAVAAGVLLADQASKAAVRAAAPAPGRIGTLVPGVLDLVRVENVGAAFSIGEGAGPLFVAIALAIAIGAFAFVIREALSWPFVVSLACVAGGGVGNLVDRVTQGSVTDFIATTFVSFPVFNVADVFITCGIAASVVCYLLWDASMRAGTGDDGESGSP